MLHVLCGCCFSAIGVNAFVVVIVYDDSSVVARAKLAVFSFIFFQIVNNLLWEVDAFFLSFSLLPPFCQHLATPFLFLLCEIPKL